MSTAFRKHGGFKGFSGSRKLTPPRKHTRGTRFRLPRTPKRFPFPAPTGDFLKRHSAYSLPEWGCLLGTHATEPQRRARISTSRRHSLAAGDSMAAWLLTSRFTRTASQFSVLGEFWHHRRGSIVRQNDIQNRDRYEQYRRGWRMIFIDEEHALKKPIYYVREALNGIEHSKFTRRSAL